MLTDRTQVYICVFDVEVRSGLIMSESWDFDNNVFTAIPAACFDWRQWLVWDVIKVAQEAEAGWLTSGAAALVSTEAEIRSGGKR